MVFSVAMGLHVAEATIEEYPASRLIERYEWHLEAQWGEITTQTAAIELGVSRALMQAFGETPEKLPSYEETLEQKVSVTPSPPPLPAWMRKFEKANANR